MTQREDKERNKTARECLGKFFYDLAKTCFLVMVAGNAVTIYADGELKIFNITSIIIGLFLTWLFAYIANKVLIKKENHGRRFNNYIFHYIGTCTGVCYLASYSAG